MHVVVGGDPAWCWSNACEGSERKRDFRAGFDVDFNFSDVVLGAARGDDLVLTGRDRNDFRIKRASGEVEPGRLQPSENALWPHLLPK